MLNNSKLYRSGCSPRVIFYSQTSKGHEYNYGKPLVSITGRSSRHITPNSSTERKLLDYIKPFPQPDSNRTIIPNCGNFDLNTYMKNSKRSKLNYGSMDNTLCEIEDKKQKSSIKISRKKNKCSSDFLYGFKKEENASNNLNEENCKKYTFYIKNKNDYNSGILNLPGGSKKKIADVKDDYQNQNKYSKINRNPTANCFRERNISSSKMSYLSPDLRNKNNKNNLSSPINSSNRKNVNLKNFSNILYSSNNIFYKNNYYSNENSINNTINDKKSILNNYHKDIKYINNINNKENNFDNCQNKTKTIQTQPFRGRNIYRRGSESKTLEENNIYKIKYNEDNKENYLYDYPNTETNYFNNKKKDYFKTNYNNTLIPNYFDNVFKGKKNSLVTPYSKRKNMNSFNKLFNEVHQQDNKYSLMNYYGKNYSKKNYSQIELH